MAWEGRGNNRYYTRSRKVAGRVVRVYLGKGPEAHLAAALDAQRRQERQAGWDALKAVRTLWETPMGALNDLIEGTDLLMHVALLGAGYRLHQRGEWRGPYRDGGE